MEILFRVQLQNAGRLSTIHLLLETNKGVVHSTSQLVNFANYFQRHFYLSYHLLQLVYLLLGTVHLFLVLLS